MEKEQKQQLSFLYVLVTWTPNGHFSTGVYRKPTYTDTYLHVTSHNCQTQKMGLLYRMVTRAVRKAD